MRSSSNPQPAHPTGARAALACRVWGMQATWPTSTLAAGCPLAGMASAACNPLHVGAQQSWRGAEGCAHLNGSDPSCCRRRLCEDQLGVATVALHESACTTGSGSGSRRSSREHVGWAELYSGSRRMQTGARASLPSGPVWRADPHGSTGMVSRDCCGAPTTAPPPCCRQQPPADGGALASPRAVQCAGAARRAPGCATA